MYHYEAELVLRSYMPEELQIGMYFVTKERDRIVLWELQEIPQDKDEFLSKNGAPMELYIIDGPDVIAFPKEIGWLDEGEDSDEYRDVTLEDLNTIINEYDGWLEIEIEEVFFDVDESVIPCFIQEKVIIRFIQEEYYEE